MRALPGVLALAAALAGDGFACSTFVMDTPAGPFFGRNYDWRTGVGRLTVNPRGLLKRALVADGRRPAAWKARYGSVTFNQYGREFPTGGMNEAGLVVELMWLEGTVYPAPDERPELSELQWIQHQLDTARTVDDVIGSDRSLRIAPESTPLHFLVADAEGGVAVVEFLEGRMAARAAGDLPTPALTNHPYGESLRAARRVDGAPAGEAGPEPRRDSLGRFSTLARRLSAPAPAVGDAVAASFDLLGQVAQGERTRWRIVYDIRGRTVHLRTGAAAGTRRLDLGRLDFACGGPVLSADLEDAAAGDVRPRLEACDGECARAALARAFEATGLEIAPERLARRARHPETSVCESAPRNGAAAP